MEKGSAFKVGDYVFHEQYKVGQIEKVSDISYTICFEKGKRVISKKYEYNLEKREEYGWKTIEQHKDDILWISFYSHENFHMYIRLPFSVEILNEYLQLDFEDEHGYKYYFSQIYVNFHNEKMDYWECGKRMLRYKTPSHFVCHLTFETLKYKRRSIVRLYKSVFSNITKKNWVSFVKNKYGSKVILKGIPNKAED